MTITYKEERLSAEEYIDFSKENRSWFAISEKRFRERIEKAGSKRLHQPCGAQRKRKNRRRSVWPLPIFVIGFMSPIWA